MTAPSGPTGTDRHAPTSAAISRRADGGALSARDDAPVRVELDRGVLEVVGIHTELCPQCGLNPAGAPKKRVWRWTPRWVFPAVLLSLPLSLAFGPLVLLGALGAGFVTRRTVKVELSLCDECDRDDRRGQLIREATATGGLLAPVLAAFALIPLNEWGVIESVAVRGLIVGTAAAAGVAGAVFGHLKTRRSSLFLQRITKKVVRLKASPTWRSVLAREQPKALAVPRGEDED